MHSIAEYLRYTYIPLFTRISFNFDHIPTRTTTMDPRLLYSYSAMPTQDCTSFVDSQNVNIKGFELGWERFEEYIEHAHDIGFARATIQLQRSRCTRTSDSKQHPHPRASYDLQTSHCTIASSSMHDSNRVASSQLHAFSSTRPSRRQAIE